MKKLLVLLVVAMLLVSALAACTPETNNTPTEKPSETVQATPEQTAETPSEQPSAEGGEIIIGSIQDLSGAMSVAGTNTKWGVEYAVNEINAAGGINGKTLKVITYDIKSDPNEAINAYNRLVDQDGAVAVVGPGLSNIGIPLAAVAEEKKVPVVGQFMDERATVDEQTGKVWNYMFLAEPSCSQQAEIMASYAVEELKIKSVGILYDSSNAYATKHAEPFKAYVESKGITVVGVESFGADAKDYKAQLSKLIANDPEALFIPNYVQTNALAYKQARQLGFEGMILGNNTWSYPLPDLVDGLPVDEGLLFLQNVDLDSELLKDMKEQYLLDFNGNQPTVNIAFGYDDVKIIENALKNVADVTDATEIAKYIEQNTKDVMTASGPISLDPANHRPLGMGAYVAKYTADNLMELIKYYIAK